MLDAIIRFSIHNKFMIAFFTVALLVWGGYNVKNLPIDAVPDITNNQIQVITLSPTLAAQEVEQFITNPIEVAMATIPQLQEVRSISRFGLSVVTVVVADEMDLYLARQLATERLREAEAQIPPGLGVPTLAPVSTGLGEIYQYVLHTQKGYAHTYTPMDLRTIQDWTVTRQLLGTPGVAEVSSFGGFLKEYEIAVQPDRLNSVGVTMAEILSALTLNNENTGGAYIDKKPNAYFIRSLGLIKSLADIEKIVVKNNATGTPVLIRDVARVQFGSAPRYGALTRNDEGEFVGASVLMLKGENSAQVIQNVKAKMARIQQTLPPGVLIEPYLDRSTLVNSAIRTVSRNLAEGALIVIFVLVLLLGNLRAGLIVASVIPLAMLFAVSLMNLFGVSGNLMSLGAIDFGLIVDGAVIIVEATLHHIVSKAYPHRLSQAQMDQEVYESASKIRNSAAFGEIIILIVYLPILALVGIEGKMFKPMAQTVIFAILGAFILSLTYVPMMSALFLSKKPSHQRNISDRILNFFHRAYAPLIRTALNRKGMVVALAAALFALSLFLFSRMGGEFLPTLEEGDLAVETTLMTGASLSQSVETFQKASKILTSQFPEVKEVIGRIGTSEIPTDPMPFENGDLMIMLKDKSDWTRAGTREELVDQMKEALQVIPGVAFGFQQPIQMRFNELISGARQDVALKIFGEDLAILALKASQISGLIQPVEGVADIYVEKVQGLPQILVELNRDKIAQYGLTIADVNRVLRTAFAGEVTGVVFEGEKRFDLVVRLEAAARQHIEDVRQLRIALPTGNQIPLEEVARIDFQDGPAQISHEDTQRRITIGFNVRGRDVESVVKEIQAKINRQFKLPPGYFITYGGQFENLQKAKARLAIAVPVALLLILTLLYLSFGNLTQALLIFTAIPLSAIGGVLALWLRGMPFSISAGVGFIALFGVAVLNGIVLISQFNQLKKEGMTNIEERVLKGTQVRLRPVFMTALVASLGFLPMALSDTAGGEVQKPLATVVIGGLVSATLLTLVVLPALYIYVEQGFKQGAFRSKGLPLFLLIGLLSLSSLGKAQQLSRQPLLLEQAIQQALENNRSIRAAGYEVDLKRALKKTASDVGKTSVGLQYGQTNSTHLDTYFSVSQTIPFPTVFKNSAGLAKTNIKASELQLAAAETRLRNQVKAVYYELAYYQAKNKLLRFEDSLLTEFVKAAGLRYKTGETNYLEKATAESQLMEVKNKASQNEADIRIYQNQLQTLLHTDEKLPAAIPTLTRRELELDTSSAALAHNPELALLRQQVLVSTGMRRLEKSRLLPDITLGYFNQSLVGTEMVKGGGQTVGPGTRFTGVEVGLAIPFWYSPLAAKVKAAAIGEKVAQASLEQNEGLLKGHYIRLAQQYHKYKSSLDYYEKSALPLTRLILENANKSFRAGAIGYVEYFHNLNQALYIRSGYLDALHQFNQSVIEMESLLGIK